MLCGCAVPRYTGRMDAQLHDMAVAPWLIWSALVCLVLAAVAFFGWRRAVLRLAAGAPALPWSSEAAQQTLEIARAQARASEQRLREVLDAVPAGLVLYDNQDRLVAINQEAALQYPYRGQEALLGTSFEDLMRRALRDGLVPDGVGREEEWLAMRLAGRGANTAAMQRHTEDGHWVHFFDNRTPSGYLVMTRLDIAPLVEKGLALERAHEQQLRLSMTDGLTGIANRRQFERTLQGEWQRCARNQTRMSTLMIDIDHFKRYNDHFGHLTGDECLRQVARILTKCIKRAGELVARYDGEEFAVLLPGADAAEALRVAERCMLQLHNARIPHADSPVSPWLTVSIGVATKTAAPAVSPLTLLQAAEQAVAAAKTAGRARVESFEANQADRSVPASI